MSTEDKVIVSGFGVTSINGTYNRIHDFNGYPLYRKDSSHLLAYFSQYGPYSFAEAYYLIKKFQIGTSIPLWVPFYRLAGHSENGSTLWQYLGPNTSGETAIGTTVLNEGSSSSSSSSSLDSSSSSSSSSMDYSSSSSSNSSSSSSSA